ncbi:hypothetical protein DOY81_009159 [Sarcophaga bullata]|nr:hypothetical protein DOY81_009159 [Sarcophaga bullata]
MGCINSTNKHIYAFKRDDIYNASVIRVQSEQSVVLARQGFFEITPQELIFISSSEEPVAWALQHLRRYGLTGNIFSFEAGRRCRTGPGIYTFRCCNADQFYAKFQRCINSMSVLGERNNSSTHPSHLFARLDSHQQNTNHYLEPTSIQLTSLVDERTTLTESNSNDSNDFNINSPDSLHSTSIMAEIIHFPSTVPSYSNINPNQTSFVSSNIYMEQPIRYNQENNNNVFAQNGKECAPIVTSSNSEYQRVYANVDSLVTTSTSQSICISSTERCYANVEVPLRIDSALTPSMQNKSFQLDLVNEELSQNTFNTPIVNYIILDLDQPRSPSQCSPKNDFGTSHSLSGSSDCIDNTKKDEHESVAAAISYGSSTMPKGSTINNENDALSNIESSGSYTRIDFLKTFALMKSSTNYTDFDLDNDQEESRITRHSKFVRKAYSISE